MSPSSRTQIVVTVGPSCSREADIEQLVAAGADVVRFNFSHGTHEEHAGFIAMVRSVGERLGRHIPIVQDLSGPRGKTEEGHAFDDDKEILTEKDLNDLDFGIAQHVDYVAQSYVGSVADVQRLRAEIVARGASIPIIAKIERDEAVHDIDAIIATADAIMVARGDLGLAEPLGEIPFIERTIIEKCKAAKKPVIIATQMLYSMVENAEPTRAEVTDEVFAIITGADAVMLSDETARGKHPLEAVQAMEKIAVRAEESNEGPAERHLL